MKQLFNFTVIATSAFVALAGGASAATCSGGTTVWTMTASTSPSSPGDAAISCFAEYDANLVAPGAVPELAALSGLEWLDYTDADGGQQASLLEYGVMSYSDQETSGKDGIIEGLLSIVGLSGFYDRLFVGLKAGDNIDPTSVVFEVEVGADGNGYFNYTVDPKQGGSVSHATLYGIPTAPIPLPAAGWLLLCGIGGLAALKRSKTLKAA
ncbi:MAG: VPLPA-CTERM sorting domain-containing protein [Pseudomonadota bacterium]|uniref:VPLPA-CTERM sorting domain-containing protein n=1 Tax=Roseovarius TaxID=74030 RepID=UPI0022A72FD2|nr:VPLPA-CTERM sorting domain-containing protein [Roseovarius sp. EGI FJ00037]MCZ0811257.1 VPLPA-CTERM sorting domain-containing protein [Roseovarius sp. EGI FJ00037]